MVLENLPALESLRVRLAESGIILRVECGRLKFTAPAGAMTPELKAEIQLHKGSLIEALSHPAEHESSGIYRASPTQRRFWRLQQLTPEETFFNEPFSFRVNGPLNAEWVHRALNMIAERHEAMRTSLREVDGELKQVVDPAGQIEWSFHDVRETSVASDENAVLALMQDHLEQHFDLTRGPGFRAMVIQVADNEFILQLVFHNTLFDLNSLFVILAELSHFYTSLATGEEHLKLPTPAKYISYTKWLEKEMNSGIERRVEYWRDWFRKGFPPALVWSNAKPKPAKPSYKVHVTWQCFSPAFTMDLRHVANALGGATLLLLMAAYTRFLQMFSGLSDVTFGTSYTGREDWRFAWMIGAAHHVPAIRVDLSGDPEPSALVAWVRESVSSALSWQNVPLETIAPMLGIDLKPGPLFQAVISAWPDTPEGKLQLPGIHADYMDRFVHDQSRPDIYLISRENKTSEGLSLSLNWLHRRDLFELDTVEAMNRAYAAIVFSMVDPLI